jgi:HAD superfamily phosphatase (TIGR01681 family)
MGHHREVDLEIHKSWWPDALAEPTRRMMMLSCGGVPISFVSFFDIQRGISAEWGFYNAPAARGAGAEALAGWLATELGAILYAFDHLGLQELYCRTSRGNAAVLMMHERMGFAPSPAQRDGIDGMVSMTLTRGEFSSRRGSPAFDGADEIEIRPDPRDRGVLASSAAGLSPESCTRICLVASANWELAGRELRETCAQILRRPFEVNVLPPGEYPMAVSELSLAAPAQITIFAERFEDLASPVGENTLLAREGAMERLERYLDSIIEARARWGGLFLVNAFAPVRPAPAAIMESEADGFVGLAERFNSALHERLTGQDDLLIVPLPELVAEIGRRQSDPGKYWLLGRLPLGQALVDRWTSCIAGLIAAKSGRSIRLIVCDLDQTLWGGVLGEGGRAQLELGSDAPGNAYRAVQAMLKSLAGRGILLGIASRNDPAEAMEMLGDPRMVLGEADFVGHRINHLPKPANVQSLIDEIGVRPECVMVLDDNPLERAGDHA